MKMRELEQKTGVDRETIRFYINAGVVPEPSRPKKNVAIYNDVHVVNIKAVKRLQEKRFLPLAVIKDLLAKNEAGGLVNAGGIRGAEFLLPELLRGATPAANKSIEEVAQTTGIDVEEINELDRLGVVSLSEGQTLDFRDASLLEHWGRMRDHGFKADEGFGAEFLVPYLELTRELARYEVHQFVEAYSETLDAEQAARRAADGLSVVNDILDLMHTKSVVQELQHVLGEPTETPITKSTA